MKPISTKTHGMLDYTTGAAMTVLPMMIDCSPATTALLESNGALAGAYSVLTDYELGLVRALPMPAHLAIDAFAGATLLGAAALMTNERPPIRALLAGLGLFEIAAAFMTETEPRDNTRRRRSSSNRQRRSPAGRPMEAATAR